MAKANDHEQAALRNEGFSAQILDNWNDDYADWALVAIFYAAAQYGRAYLAATSPTTLTSHPEFERAWVLVTGKRDLYKHYRRLKDESERARYDCAKFTRSETQQLSDGHFKPWRDWIMKSIPRPRSGK